MTAEGIVNNEFNMHSLWRSIWTMGVAVIGIICIAWLEHQSQKTVASRSTVTLCFAVAVLSSIVCGVAYVICLGPALIYMFPYFCEEAHEFDEEHGGWSSAWTPFDHRVFLLSTILTFLYQNLRQDTTTRVVGTATVCATAVVALITPYRYAESESGVLLSVLLTVILDFFKGYYPWCFATWRSTIYYPECAPFTTGDVVLVSNTGLSAQFIKFFTNSHWSHAGMLICDPPQEILDAYNIPRCAEDPYGAYLWDSMALRSASDCQQQLRDATWTAYGNPSQFNRTKTSGLDLTSMLRELKSSKDWSKTKKSFFFECCRCVIPETALFERSVLVVRRLRHKEKMSNRARYTAEFTQFLLNSAVKSYETDEGRLVSSTLRCNTANTDGLFCSEAVAEGLQALGALSKESDAANYTPEDFNCTTYWDRVYERIFCCNSVQVNRQPDGIMATEGWSLDSQHRISVQSGPIDYDEFISNLPADKQRTACSRSKKPAFSSHWMRFVDGSRGPATSFEQDSENTNETSPLLGTATQSRKPGCSCLKSTAS